jgi:hypothetical protein
VTTLEDLRDARRAGSCDPLRARVIEAVLPLGTEIRAGAHTGELATIDGEVGAPEWSSGGTVPPFPVAADGFFAMFDGPTRGVRCAQAITGAVRPLGPELRTGLHTDEVETIDGKFGGIAVHMDARVGALIAPSEVPISQTVKDLVAGSGLVFEDAGEHEMKGVADR